MKKFVSTILLVTYFLVSTGFSVNLHYCMNKYHSWELGAAENDNCEKCGMDTQKSNGCCRDDFKVLKISLDKVAAKAVAYQFSLPALPTTTFSSWFILPDIEKTALQEYRINGPPLLSKQNTYLNNCVFRI